MIYIAIMERSWNNYRQTFPTSPSLHSLARCGDLRGLADFLVLHPGGSLEERDARGYSPLMLAVYNGQAVFCEALLRGGADVDSPDAMGNTTLMGAAFKGNMYILDLLLKYGASLEARNRSGMNALDWAKTFGRGEALAFLQSRCGARAKASSRLVNGVRMLRLALSMIRRKLVRPRPLSRLYG